MSDLFWLTDAPMARLKPYFPKSRGQPRVDDRRVLSGIFIFNRNGLRWRDLESLLSTLQLNLPQVECALSNIAIENGLAVHV